MNNDDNNDHLDDSGDVERLNAAVDRLLSGEPIEATDPLLRVARHLRSLPFDPSPIARARFDQQVHLWFESDQKQAVGLVWRSWRRSLVTLIGFAATLVIVAGLGFSFLSNLPPAARPTPTTAAQPRTVTVTSTVTMTTTSTVTASPTVTSTSTPSVSPSYTASPAVRVSPTATAVPSRLPTNTVGNGPANPSLNPVVATSAPYPQPTKSEADAAPSDHQPEPTDMSPGS